ncbi:MAG: calcium-binding protein [Microcoleus sp. CSU_2_2]|nr:calcium-binding protein [Microcoleus sp. SU_5_3]NJS10221.1 calcium-binding protein [Microcoleus sp. CSU_2_2]
MRILFTIAHFYNPSGDGKHASQRNDPQPRLNALTACVTSLQALYGKSQCMIHIGECATMPVNQGQKHEIDIVICTTQGYHLLPQLPVQPKSFMHHATKCEPLLLGFECQAVLRACLEKYDYFCYLEDDLILHDPWFFSKLKWFTHHGGNGNLLQPNRYEVSAQGPVFKAYIDGNLATNATAKFQNVEEHRQLLGKIMEQSIAFERSLNPHSGCYFLNAEQMAHWANQSDFLDRDTSFIGPLESAATLGIMRNFRVYKPSPSYANFLEIQHFGSSFLKLIGNKVRISEDR